MREIFVLAQNISCSRLSDDREKARNRENFDFSGVYCGVANTVDRVREISGFTSVHCEGKGVWNGTRNSV